MKGKVQGKKGYICVSLYVSFKLGRKHIIEVEVGTGDKNVSILSDIFREDLVVKGKHIKTSTEKGSGP